MSTCSQLMKKYGFKSKSERDESNMRIADNVRKIEWLMASHKQHVDTLKSHMNLRELLFISGLNNFWKYRELNKSQQQTLDMIHKKYGGL